MATIYIENKPYKVGDGRNLLEACLDLGFDIPYFCWHPVLGSVGACRQCAVKLFRDDKDTSGRIIMSCMTEVKDGMRLSVDDPEVLAFRKSVIEWLMLNHPHDCPVCDEGGECHLQDMTVMTGHVYRKTRFRKRTFQNQYLGPFVNHEMNRCIQCYRCVRFYRDYAGGRDLNVFSAHDHVYFGRYRDGILRSEFSGNLVEICPTGVFTDKTLKKHYTRKWDLQTAPSVCVHCGLGCNTIPGERYGSLRRIMNRFNAQVNSYFLCDRGRYGCAFVNSPDRIRTPLIRTETGEMQPASPEKVQDYFRGLYHFGTRAIGIGSPTASLEANYALRTLVGSDSFFLGLSMTDYRLLSLVTDILKKGPACIPSLEDMRNSDAVLILGEDVTNTAPLADLAVRCAVRQQPLKKMDAAGIPRWNELGAGYLLQDEKGPLFIASPARSKLDDIATAAYRATPDDIARLGFAIAHELHSESPQPGGLSDRERSFAVNAANALSGAEKPLIISGTGCKSEAVIQAAANIAWAVAASGRVVGLSYMVHDCNSLGLALMGGGSIEDAFSAINKSNAETVVILERDIYRLTDKASADYFLSKIKHVILLDSLPSETADKAELVLPAATFAESDGIFVNNEGRAQRFCKVFDPTHEVRESFSWLTDMLKAAGNVPAGKWNAIDDIDKSMAETLPPFRMICGTGPAADFRINGMKVPRRPHRYSGRTAMHADISIHEPRPADDPDSALAFSMEGYENMPPPSLVVRYWAPGWNSVQALNRFQDEVGGPLRGGDPGMRLIEPREMVPQFFLKLPGAHVRKAHSAKEWLIVPLHHIFGSGELSMRTPEIAGLAPAPYLALNADDIKHLKVAEGEMVTLIAKGISSALPVRLEESLPDGVAGVPFALPALGWFDYSVRYRIARTEQQAS